MPENELEDKILAMIEGWRLELAKNIALRNPALSVYNLNSAVQKIIDRIIFLRIAEDKDIEDEDLLKTVVQTGNIYEKLNLLFIKANTKYDAGLFTSDDWLIALKVDDKILSSIVNSLYYPECNYSFRVLPLEILGRIYEKFLGKTVRFRNVAGSHTAIIEEKPEVRKAGGVFYTPQYIVEYIVQNTVGRIIGGKTPEEVSKVKICDPACGSGSMLVGAYQYLLKYHLDYWSEGGNVKKALKNSLVFQVKENEYKLTIDYKQQILQNNIFGVDIDPQACEVTKLSLYLKLLENEGNEAAGRLFKAADLTLLPSLEENIKCGNSIVGTDFYNQGTLALDDDFKMKVNCFDWEREFSGIIKAGGFDVILGNPPYYNIQTLGAGSEIAEYIQDKYSGIWQDKSDILFYFLDKALKLSRSEIGFIVSNAFLFSDKAKKLRNLIIDDGRLAKIVNFEQYQVFKDASITSGVFLFNKGHEGARACVMKGRNYSIDAVINYINDDSNYFDVSFKKDKVFALVDARVEELNNKIDGGHPKLSDMFFIGRGMETAANDVFVFQEKPEQFPDEYIKRRISGENISRYFIDTNTDYLLYFEDEKELKKLPETIQKHLKNNKKILLARATVKNEGRNWWRYSRPLHKEYYSMPKIVCSYRNKNNEFAIDNDSNNLCLSNCTVIFDTNGEAPLMYLLAILNSRLFKWRYNSLAKQTGSGVFEYMPNSIGRFPVPKADKTKQEALSGFVTQMLALKQKEHSEPNPQAKKIIARQIGALDAAIDKAVYELYGLSQGEIKTIENGS